MSSQTCHLTEVGGEGLKPFRCGGCPRFIRMPGQGSAQEEMVYSLSKQDHADKFYLSVRSSEYAYVVSLGKEINCKCTGATGV
jgi:hypothetical protein